MSDIYFAIAASPSEINDLITFPGLVRPNILISFFYLAACEKTRPLVDFKGHKMMLDSGAYSAYNSGKKVDIEALIEETKKTRWDESVGLDVIGDANGSLKNAEYMRSKGSPAMPVFHIGDPWDILDTYCRKFDKVGLSCRFGEPVKDSMAWLRECFAREWPHKFHSFGWVMEDMLMEFPFHSADASSWKLAPRAFGTWKSVNLVGASHGHKIKSMNHSLHPEIAWYMKSQAKLKLRWRAEWQKQGWAQ